jgi:hypothetical protein
MRMTKFWPPLDKSSPREIRSPIHNGSMMVEGGTVPTAGYDATNFVNKTSIAVEVSILGYQMEGKEPGYSFGMRGVYHLGNPPRDATITPTKKRRGGCIISPRRRKAAVFNADTSNISQPQLL